MGLLKKEPHKVLKVLRVLVVLITGTYAFFLKRTSHILAEEIFYARNGLDKPLNDNRMLHVNATDSLCAEQTIRSNKLLKSLCNHNLEKHINDVLHSSHDFHIFQIGAHTGFERNDPLAKSLSIIIEALPMQLQQRVHWTFVEPSPPNYKRLQKTVLEHSNLCDMNSINAAVVSDQVSDVKTKDMIFYSLLDTIDPVTGYDERSGKTFPAWITQISSFSKDPILYNGDQFSRRGLNVSEYIVETNVTVRHLSSLLAEFTAVFGGFKPGHLFFVLIDTEGYDCDIINGLVKDSPFWPFYLVFEHKQCKDDNKIKTYRHLAEVGYSVNVFDSENTLAVR